MQDTMEQDIANPAGHQGWVCLAAGGQELTLQNDMPLAAEVADAVTRMASVVGQGTDVCPITVATQEAGPLSVRGSESAVIDEDESHTR